eukprot:2231764-Alexandrium_andersonii.AAC.1
MLVKHQLADERGNLTVDTIGILRDVERYRVTFERNIGTPRVCGSQSSGMSGSNTEDASDSSPDSWRDGAVP